MTELRVTASEPADVDEAREAIERSRERISETLGAIEDRLVETRDSIRDRVDVLRPVKDQVRIRPWMAVAVAAGVGAAIGGVLGGSDEDERPSRRRGSGGFDGDLPHQRGRHRYSHDDDHNVRDVERHFTASARRDRHERDDHVDVISAEERRRRRAYRAQRRELLAEREAARPARRSRASRHSASRREARETRDPESNSGSSSIRSDIMRAITGAITAGLRDRMR